MTLTAYSPPRNIAAKFKRRATQRYAARPATLRFDQPILSISFDDFPVSAAEHGAAVLEAHGARGTYYASAGLAQTEGPCGLNFSAGHLSALAARGHEIGCHTFGHEDCARRSALETLRDLAQNRDALAVMGAPAAAQTLAFPYGETTIELKQSLPPRYRCARGILPGLNVGAADLAQLHAYALFGANWRGNLRHALKRAAKKKAWVIGFTHDVSAAPSPWGAHISELDALLSQAQTLGFAILPVNEALDRRRP